MKKTLYITGGIVIGLALAAFSITRAAPVICKVFNGCTGSGIVPSLGQVLVGQSNGTYAPQATSTLGITPKVSSVFGRIGAIIAQTGDYTTSQVTEGSNLYFTNV